MRPSHLIALVARAAACACLASGGETAHAQVRWDLEAAVNNAHNRTEPGGESSTTLDVHPGLTLIFGSPRLVWRGHYAFSGSYTYQGDGDPSYNNAASFALAAQTSERTGLGVSLAASQGSTVTRLTQRPVEAGGPALRAPGNPAQLEASLNESFTWEAAPGVTLGQLASLELSAPQEALDRRNLVATGSLTASKSFPADALGMAFTARRATLRPAAIDLPSRVDVFTMSTQLSWNKDLDQRWNASMSAGGESVRRLGGAGSPAASRGPEMEVHPIGSLSVRHIVGRGNAILSYVHGAMANLEEGTLSLSDSVLARFGWVLGQAPFREVSASAGWLDSRPLRSAGLAAGEGTAYSADLGVIWGLGGAWVANARYSWSRQHDAAGRYQSTLQALAVGIAWHSDPGLMSARTVPSSGERVDGGDGVTFAGERRSSP